MAEAFESPPEPRPYRSHLRPACLQCRRRKSRCKLEQHSPRCLMCSVHGTPCEFPGQESNSPQRQRKAAVRQRIASRWTEEQRAPTIPPNPISPAEPRPTPPAGPGGLESHPQAPLADLVAGVGGVEARDSSHIVGPAVTGDTQVLSQYLSTEPGVSGRPARAWGRGGGRASVMFTSVRKHPLGISSHQTVAQQKNQVIEKLLEPWLEELIDLYLEKVNLCFPLLEPSSFRYLYRNEKENISPSLLACIYAHMMAFWRWSPRLSAHHCPDVRFIWNMASEALYSELYLSPGIATIIAILINTGGRPTTSMIGNSVQLGSAVSLAHSLGLNRDPLDWDMQPSEKLFRIKLWWGLLIHDKWCCLAYGTPSHIRRGQYDVPTPRLEYLCSQIATPQEVAASSVYVALATLTETLDNYLEYLYRLDLPEGFAGGKNVADLGAGLDNWEESLGDDVRRIIIRGTNLHIPGAANLRLAYLSIRLHGRKIELDIEKQKGESAEGSLARHYLQVRRAAEEIVLFVQELEERHLGDFWLPVAAFAFASTVTFLLRCALETENSAGGLAQSASLRLAKDLITALAAYRQDAGWDLGDLCLAQYTEVVDKLLSSTAGVSPSTAIPELQELVMSDIPDVDELFPSLWDMFEGT
ncbi:fungal-specific transcription factor domain-containing protein [Thozetella sp. PMI_491]|nr:fungal-specific transcription factor domain-containing protein [Thozetella sp. PMI_491]